MRVKAPNIVIKANKVYYKDSNAYVVKLSDEKGKYTGNEETISRYLDLFR